MGVNRNTVNRYFNIIREKIFRESLKETEKEIGTFKLDESYFRAKEFEVKGEGATGKTPVFGLLKRDEKVFAQIVQIIFSVQQNDYHFSYLPESIVLLLKKLSFFYTGINLSNCIFFIKTCKANVFIEEKLSFHFL